MSSKTLQQQNYHNIHFEKKIFKILSSKLNHGNLFFTIHFIYSISKILKQSFNHFFLSFISGKPIAFPKCLSRNLFGCVTKMFSNNLFVFRRLPENSFLLAWIYLLRTYF